MWNTTVWKLNPISYSSVQHRIQKVWKSKFSENATVIWPCFEVATVSFYWLVLHQPMHDSFRILLNSLGLLFLMARNGGHEKLVPRFHVAKFSRVLGKWLQSPNINSETLKSQTATRTSLKKRRRIQCNTRFYTLLKQDWNEFRNASCNLIFGNFRKERSVNF